MPRSGWSAAVTTEFKKRNGFMPVILVDLELRDGATRYYLSDFPGTYPVKLGAGPTAVYSPWIKSAGPFRISRNLQTDAGDVVLENLSGNSIVRDISAALKGAEFEGAMCIVRFWHELLQTSTMEFHGTLSDQNDDQEQATFRELQLFDLNSLQMPLGILSEQCDLRYKSTVCGSAGAATVCSKDFATCIDVNHAAGERYNGVPIVPPGLAEVQMEQHVPQYGRSTVTDLDRVNPEQIVTYSTVGVAKLGMPVAIAYGLCRVKGVTVLQHQKLSDLVNTMTLFVILGRGEWGGCVRIWLNQSRYDPTDTTRFHFHAGNDGTLGGGLLATSIGPDQGVDSFTPIGVTKVTFSRRAYMALKVDGPDTLVSTFDHVGDYQTRKCRVFDAAGNQTAYQYTLVNTWQILDVIIDNVLKREGTSGQALTAAEAARIDFPSFVQHATDCSFDIGGGIARCEGHLAIGTVATVAQVLDQMLRMCMSFLVEVDGKIFIYMDKARAATFTMTADHVADRIQVQKPNKRNAANRYQGRFRDLNEAKIADIETLANSGAVRAGGVVTIKTKTEHAARVADLYMVAGVSVGTNTFNGTFKVASVIDDFRYTYAQAGANETQGGGYVAREESRFAEATKIIDHEEHQFMAGQRGVGLSTVPKVIPVDYDLGNNTYERVERILKYLAVRDLGVGLVNGDLAGASYKVPREMIVKAWMHSVDAANNALMAQIPGDLIALDASVSDEYAGTYEIMEMLLPRIASGSHSDTMVELRLKEYIAAAFTDAAGPQPVKTGAYPGGGPFLIQNDGRYRAYEYHDSAARVGSSTDRLGSTTSLTYVTVASFTLHLPTGVTSYKAIVAAKNIDANSFVAGPSAAAQVGALVAWTTITNALAQDAATADVALTGVQQSNTLNLTGFGFAIPTYHTILGITVRIRRKDGSNNVKDSIITLLNPGGGTIANKAAAGNWPVALTDASYGGAADLWAASIAWTAANINNAAFGVSIKAVATGGGGGTGQVDFAEVTVTTDRGSVSGTARLKIGAQVSTDVVLTSPAVTASALRQVTGLTPNSDVTVETQAVVTSASGSVQGSLTQIQYTDQDFSHFDL